MLFYYKSLGRTIVGLLLLLGFAQQIHAQWSIAELHPAAANNSGLYGGAAGQQVGYITTSGGPTHAGYWSGASGSFVDLDPTGTWLSYAFASNGSQQGGSVSLASAPFEQHAYLWSGTAASGVDLHPSAYYASGVLAMSGAMQGGFVSSSPGNSTERAAIWSGTAASFMDLHPASHPAGFIASRVTAMAGSQQAGFGLVGGGSPRALLWNGSAGSVVYLHAGETSDLTNSAVNAMTETHQGGYITQSGVVKAAMWAGSYSSRVDLHPAGATSSRIFAMVNGFQAGQVDDQAAVWQGSPGSYVNLHGLVTSNLGTDYTKSKVTGAYIDNDTVFLVGAAINTVNPSEVAVLWSMPLPRPPPVITRQPISRHVAHSSDPVFAVEASGTGVISYQWQENNFASDYLWVDISGDNFRYEGENKASLTVLNTLHVTQNTQFRCVVSDENGSVTSDAATITYFYTAPTITQQPLSQTILEGTPLELAVGAQSVGSALLPYQWKKNGQNISAATERTYSIPSAGLADQGDYQAVATNSIGSTLSDVASVRVLAPSQIVSISVGAFSGVFLRSDGSLWGNGNRYWFGNVFGRTDFPVYIAENIIKADAASYYTAFIKEDNTLWYVGLQLFDQNHELQHREPVQIASDVVDVKIGTETIYFIKKDRTLWGVGKNENGQLGDGTTTYRTDPVLIASDVQKVAGGSNRMFFLKTDGSLCGLGSTTSRTFGDGTEITWMQPVEVASSVRIVFGAASSRITLYLKNDNTLWGMGALESLSSNFTNPPPGTAIQLASDIVDAAVGSEHILFLKDDGTLWGLGQNAEGQLGDGTFTNRDTPVQVASAVTSVAAGGFHSFYLKQDGTLWEMGKFTGGTQVATPIQVAAGPLQAPASPAQLSAVGASSFSGVRLEWDLVLGASSYEIWRSTQNDSAAATKIGTVSETLYDDVSGVGGTTYYYWIKAVNGTGDSGLGDVVSATASIVQMPVITQHPADRTVGPGAATTFSVTATGEPEPIYQWQRSTNGGSSWNQLFDGSGFAGVNTSTLTLLTSFTQPGNHGDLYRVVATNGAGQAISNAAELTVTAHAAPIQISGGSNYSLFLRLNGEVWGMGRNQEGQFGYGNSGQQNSPVASVSDIVSLTAGSEHSLLIKTNGTLLGTGFNEYGALGTGTVANAASPVTITSGVAETVGTHRSSFFRKTDGTLWAMGWNVYGQLGDGTTTNRLSPVHISDHVTGMAAGYFQSLFVKSDGTLWAMGDNTYGQFGNGTTTGSLTPVQVNTGVKQVSSGHYHTLILKQDQSLWATGLNNQGQLGDGTNITVNTPVQVTTDVQAIATGALHSVFLKTDGTLWTMGHNGSGQLGDSSTTNRSTPMQIDTQVTSITAGHYFTQYTKTDGTLWAMGANEQGQLGDGSTTTRLTPVPIASGGGGLPQTAAQPTATVSDSTDRITLTWNHVIGASHYEIWRSETDDRSSATRIADRITGNFHEDLTATQGVTYFYWIDAINPYGSRQGNSAQGRHGVLAAVMITTQPQNVTTIEGEDHTFSVVAIGAAPLTYQWYFAGELIPGATEASYTITDIDPGDVGSYKVLVTNPVGTLSSDQVQLTITNLPWVTAESSSRMAALGDSLSLSVTTAKNTNTYEWSHNGLIIPGATSNSLHMSSIAWGDHGIYAVKISNENGYVRRIFHLNVTQSGVSLESWGDNSHGQLSIPSGLNEVAQIATGANHSVVLKGDGTVVSWGANDDGQSNVPAGLSGVVQIAAGMDHTLALKADGTVVAWGLDDHGQGSVPEDLAQVAAIYAGERHNIALKRDGTVVAWGEAGNELNAMLSAYLDEPVGFAMGSSHSMVITNTNGVLWKGRMPSDSLESAALEIALRRYNSNAEVVSVAAGNQIGVALDSDGTVKVFGGSDISQSSGPSPNSGIVEISMRKAHGLALLSNGIVLTWGHNTYGQRNVPSGLVDVTSIAAGGAHNLVVINHAVGFAPSIMSHPSSVTLNPGDSSTLSVTAVGRGLTYQWRKNGETLFGGNGVSGTRESVLHLDEATSDMAGTYDVVVSNVAGTVYSDSVTVSLNQATQTIVFTQGQLVDQSYHQNPLILDATATSGLPVSFTVLSGPATISGDQLTLTGTGTVVVRASQAGNENYLSAEPVDRSFTVSGNAQSWLTDYFTEAELDDEAISGPSADPDGDGMTNLLEYALGLDPRGTETSGQPEMSTTATEWVYTYTRPVDRADITYEVEISTDLSSWASSEVTHEMVSTDGNTQTWKATVPLTSGDTVFFRLKIAQ